MCKGMPVILVNRVVDPKRKIVKIRAKKEERHKWSLTKRTSFQRHVLNTKTLLRN
jgi:hypothetical protein